MTPDQPQAKPRSKRLYILWAIALTLLISTALFCWLVVVPVWRASNVLEGCVKQSDEKKALEQLGGPERTRRCLTAYLGAPHWMTKPSLRERAVSLLGATNRQAVPLLIELLESDDDDISASALGALYALGPEASDAAGPLLLLTRSDYPRHTRLSAIHALSAIAPRDCKVVMAMGSIAITEEDLVAKVALGALQSAGPSAASAIDPLVHCLRQRPNLREAAAWAIRDVGPAGKAAVPALLEAMEDREPIVRVASATALWKVTGKIEPSLGVLTAALQNEDPRVVGFAVKAIGGMGPGAAPAAPGLAALLTGNQKMARSRIFDKTPFPMESDPKVRKLKEGLVAAMSKNMAINSRIIAAHILGTLGVNSKEVITALQTATQDDEPLIREAAADALEKIRTAQQKK